MVQIIGNGPDYLVAYWMALRGGKTDICGCVAASFGGMWVKLLKVIAAPRVRNGDIFDLKVQIIWSWNRYVSSTVLRSNAPR